MFSKNVQFKKDISEYKDEITNLKTILKKANYEIQMLKEDIEEYKSREFNLLHIAHSEQQGRQKSGLFLEKELESPVKTTTNGIIDGYFKHKSRAQSPAKSDFNQSNIDRIERKLKGVLRQAATLETSRIDNTTVSQGRDVVLEI